MNLFVGFFILPFSRILNYKEINLFLDFCLFFFFFFEFETRKEGTYISSFGYVFDLISRKE